MAFRCPNTHEVVFHASPDGPIEGSIFAECDDPNVQTAPGDPAKGDTNLDCVARAPGFNGIVQVRVKGDADPTSGQRFLEDVHEIEFHDPEATSLGSAPISTRPIA